MLKQETKQIQHSLADYCKSNETANLPGVKPDRLHHYRRLIYNIIDDAIESAYPITRSILTDENWKKMVDEFVAEHPCSNPQLFKMPSELIDFAQQKGYANDFSIPYLYDLLNFEWIEVEVHSMTDVPESNYIQTGDFLREPLTFTPYFQLLKLDYPIHQLKSKDIAALKGHYYLMVYREDNGTVQYLELNLLTHHLVSQMHFHNASLLDVLEPELEDVDKETQNQLIDQSNYFIFQLKSMGIVKGVQQT